MKLSFIINTPGQAHTWKNVIRKLIDDKHEIRILARDYGSTPLILKACGFTFDTFQPVGARYSRLFGSFRHFQICYDFARENSPTAVIGFGIDAAVAAAMLRKPAIVFIDDDQTPFQNGLTRYLGTAIITPDCFRGKLGKNHVRVNGYKELAYLHPNYFQPDSSILDKLQVKRTEKYVILRFNVADAVHDIGSRANRFTLSEQLQLVKELEKYARVFVSPEGKLPPQLEPYRLTLPYDKFHHALYYAQLFVADTGTASVEAALLGTPVILCNHHAMAMGNFRDLNRREMLYLLDDAGKAIEKASELIQTANVKEQWIYRRSNLLADRIDVGRFLINFIENYPQSLTKYQNSVIVSA